MTEQPAAVPEPGASAPPTEAAAAHAPAFVEIWARIKEHKLMQWTLAYAAAGYTLLHGAEMLSEAQEWPRVLIVRVFSLVLILGIPVVLTLAWYHGAKGSQRVSGPELVMITVLLFIAAQCCGSCRIARRKRRRLPRQPSAGNPLRCPQPRRRAHPPRHALRSPYSRLPISPAIRAKITSVRAWPRSGSTRSPKSQGLKVPARTSTFAYKDRNTDIRQIGKDLGVGSILEGSVRAAGKRIRITAQLIDAQNGLHLWSETYDEEFTDIFKLPDRLGRRNRDRAATEPARGCGGRVGAGSTHAGCGSLQPLPARSIAAPAAQRAERGQGDSVLSAGTGARLAVRASLRNDQ